MSGEASKKGLKVLEFFGVPGVGKSYLLSRAVPSDIERPMDWFHQGWRAQRIRRKVSLMLRYLPVTLATVVWARKVIRVYQPMGWRRQWKVLFNWVFVDCLIREAARGRNPVLVLDQGIAQALWATQFGTGEYCSGEQVRTLLRRYLEGLPISEWAVVRVTAAPEVVCKRLEEREGLSPVDRDPGAIDEAYRAERGVVAVLLDLERSVENQPKLTIVKLENDGEDAASRLKDVMGWSD